MATEAVGGAPTLFLRKATGLVRGWSVRDSLIYACLATNFVTLGIYEFTFAARRSPRASCSRRWSSPGSGCRSWSSRTRA